MKAIRRCEPFYIRVIGWSESAGFTGGPLVAEYRAEDFAELASLPPLEAGYARGDAEPFQYGVQFVLLPVKEWPK